MQKYKMRDKIEKRKWICNAGLRINIKLVQVYYGQVYYGHSNRGPSTRPLHIEGLKRVKQSFFDIVLKSIQTTEDRLGRRVTDSVPESNNSVKIRGLKC